MTYDVTGQVDTVIDPLGRVIAFYHDDLGREIATIENRVHAGIAWSSSLDRWVVTGVSSGVINQDRVVSVVYCQLAPKTDPLPSIEN